MSEYIVDTFGIVQDFSNLHGDRTTPLYQAIMDVVLLRQREEIVRCRDCKWLIEQNNMGKTCTFFGVGICQDELDTGYCAWGAKAVEQMFDKYCPFCEAGARFSEDGFVDTIVDRSSNKMYYEFNDRTSAQLDFILEKIQNL